jgi:hypothetical protein
MRTVADGCCPTNFWRLRSGGSWFKDNLGKTFIAGNSDLHLSPSSNGAEIRRITVTQAKDFKRPHLERKCWA